MSDASSVASRPENRSEAAAARGRAVKSDSGLIQDDAEFVDS